MCPVSRRTRRALIAVLVAIVLLPVLYVGAWMAVFAHCASDASELSACRTRDQIVAKLPGYRDRQLALGERPVWPFLHTRNKELPKDLVSCEYRWLGLPGRHAAICVAYDRNDRVIGIYEYD